MSSLSAALGAILLAAPLIAVPAAAQSFALHPYGAFGDPDARTASAALGDLDGDGDLDAFLVNGRHWAEQDEVAFNNGLGFFASLRDAGARRATGYRAALADVDGDGDLDAFIARDLLPPLLLRNDGAGGFDAGTEIGPLLQARSAAAADLDGDGDLDFIAAQRGGANVLYFNDGSGGFDRLDGLEGEHQTINIAVGDVDGDGAVDLVFSNRGGQGAPLYINDGAGGFGPPVMIGAEEALESRSVAFADMTGDGVGDLVLSAIGAPGAIYAGDGAGGFVLAERFGASEDSVFGLAIADFNGDGRLDIAAAHTAKPSVVHLRTEDGFETVPVGETAVAAYDVAAGDLDGDGAPDLVFAVSGGRNFIALNRFRR